MDFSAYQMRGVDAATLGALEALDGIPDHVRVTGVHIWAFPGAPVAGGDTHAWSVDIEYGLSSSPVYNDPSKTVPGPVERLRPYRQMVLDAAQRCRDEEAVPEPPTLPQSLEVEVTDALAALIGVGTEHVETPDSGPMPRITPEQASEILGHDSASEW